MRIELFMIFLNERKMCPCIIFMTANNCRDQKMNSRLADGWGGWSTSINQCQQQRDRHVTGGKWSGPLDQHQEPSEWNARPLSKSPHKPRTNGFICSSGKFACYSWTTRIVIDFPITKFFASTLRKRKILLSFEIYYFSNNKFL